MRSLFDIVRRKLLVRRALIIIAHTILYAAAFTGAFLLRFDFKIPDDQLQHFYLGMGLIVGLRLMAGFVFRIYGGVLRYAGISDLLDIIKSMSLATAAFVVALVLFGFRGFPRSIIAIDWVAAIMLVGGLRFTLRVMREMLQPGPQAHMRKRVLIIGAGDAAEALVRDLLRTYRDRYEVVGFLDDNKSKQGLRIHDVRVLGPIMYLGDFVPRYQVDEVIVAIPSATGPQMRRIVDVTKIAGVRIKTIPGMDQLIDGTVTVSQIRDVAIEDLLGRAPVELEERLLHQFLSEKVVMVTGAGGSIGAELCRQICRFMPRKLLLLEQSEPNLFFIHSELRNKEDIEVVPLIADVTDVARLLKVFSTQLPEVIFHAAAHKHVPMMEWNPGEAIKNNVFGTRTVADMANLFAAQAFVMISTDKAVNPTSVMGASKRVSEMYVQSLADTSKTSFTAVRFGNVLGSVGSVVPIFREQIARGGPVTVTHPDMRRYFMTIPESCQLVMQAAAMGEGGEIFVLDMGEPVRILDLARDLITLSGFEPDRDIKIEFTGLRPGEKLFEEIGFDAEKMSKTRHPKIYTGKLAPQPIERMQVLLSSLVQVVNDTDEVRIKAALKAIVPEFDTPVAPELPDAEDAKKARPAARIGLSDKEPSRVRTDEDAAPAETPEAPHRPAARIGLSGKESTRADAERPRGREHRPEEADAVQKGRGALRPEEADADQKGRGALRSAVTEVSDGHNPLFDGIWADFVRLCRAQGFASVAWNTMGVRPADRREQDLEDGGEEADRRVLRRSVPITSLSFIELRFTYAGGQGKRTPDHFRRAVRSVAHEITRNLVGISREVAAS